MTEPGIIYPPQPGWWIRTAKVGINQSAYAWASDASGLEIPLGVITAGYNWTTVDTIGFSVPKYLSSGSTQSSTSSPMSWSETIPAGTDVALLWVAEYAHDQSGVGATLGGVPMVFTENLRFDNESTFAGYLYCFTMLAPPAGTQTFQMSNADTEGLVAATAYYRNVGSVGTPTTRNAMSVSVTTSSSSTLYAQAFSYLTNSAGDTITSYNENLRSPSGAATTPGFPYDPLVFGDALGNGGTLTFSATRAGSTTYGAGAVVVPLIPPVASIRVAPTGIPSGEGVGTPTVTPGSTNIAPTGIASAEAFGAAHVSEPQFITPTGIVSTEAFGTAAVGGPPQSVAPTGITSTEAFGSDTVTPGSVNISPTGIASAEALGIDTVAPGSVNISPSGIASAEAFGTALVAGGPQYISGGTAQQTEHTTSATTLSLSWSETIPSGTALAVVWVATDDSGTTGSHTATLGGTSMTLTQNLAVGNSGGFFANLYCFTMLAPPAGSQAFVVNRATSYAVVAATAYYRGVSSLGTPVTVNNVSSGTSVSMSATSTSASNRYIQAFAALASTSGHAITAYSQTQRSPSGIATSSDGYYDPLLFGDAGGNGGTLSFSVTKSSADIGGGVIVPLVP